MELSYDIFTVNISIVSVNMTPQENLLLYTKSNVNKGFLLLLLLIVVVVGQDGRKERERGKKGQTDGRTDWQLKLSEGEREKGTKINS